MEIRGPDVKGQQQGGLIISYSLSLINYRHKNTYRVSRAYEFDVWSTMFFAVHTDEAAVNAEEQQIALQLMAEPRMATTPSTIAQTANRELVVTAPAGCTHTSHIKHTA